LRFAPGWLALCIAAAAGAQPLPPGPFPLGSYRLEGEDDRGKPVRAIVALEQRPDGGIRATRWGSLGLAGGPAASDQTTLSGGELEVVFLARGGSRVARYRALGADRLAESLVLRDRGGKIERQLSSRGDRVKTAFPLLAPRRVDMDIDLDVWAVIPGDPKRVNGWEWLGRIMELCPGCRKQWADVSCDGAVVRLWPHYERSSWDDFQGRARGPIRSTGLGGLWPFTLGPDSKNRAGLVAVLRAAAGIVESGDALTAAKLRKMAERIAAGP
jgi:hypothetical protein